MVNIIQIWLRKFKLEIADKTVFMIRNPSNEMDINTTLYINNIMIKKVKVFKNLCHWF